MLAALDAAPAVITFCDTELRVQFANKFAVAWLGGTRREDVLGRKFADLLPPEVYAANLPYALAALNGTPQTFQRSFIDAAGQLKHAQAAFTPFGSPGEVTGFFVHVADITDPIESEVAQREQARQLAIMSERERSFVGFAGTMTRRLFAISLTLGGLQTGTGERDERISAAIDEINETLREIRTHLAESGPASERDKAPPTG